ncbi:MAG: M48 family metallopeptidase [Spirochaetes bacterium]|nr:M48 family metallopeptidase [Spirochaetota bacterium]
MIEYKVIRRRVKYSRIVVKKDRVFLIVPWFVTNTDSIIRKKKKWIVSKLKEFESLRTDASRHIDINALEKKVREGLSRAGYVRSELKKKVTELCDLYASLLQVGYRKIFIRSQRTKWASVSSRGNINFNFNLAFVPERLLKLVVYHELLHFRIKNHNREFKARLKDQFPDLDLLERLLNYYALLLNQFR